MGGMDPQDLSSQFSGGGRPSGPRKTKDLVHHVHVTLEDLYKGKTSKLALTRNVICSKCNGRGGKEGAVQTCTTCHGQGVKITLRMVDTECEQTQKQCDSCSGTGAMINAKDRCKACNGKKVISEKKMLEVHIDKGMKGGQTIKSRGESDQAPGATPGDVVIVIEEEPHERFRRQGDDLFIDQEIDLLTALCGGHFSIRHLDDRILFVSIRPLEVIKDGDLKVIRRQGMPSQRYDEPGDLCVHFTVKFPKDIDPESMARLESALESIFPARPKVPKGVDIEAVTLEEADTRQRERDTRQRERASTGEAMGEDDDEEEPREQCTHQ